MAIYRIRIDLKPGDVDVDPAAVEKFMRDPSGPVLRDLIRRGNNVEKTARFYVGVDTGTLSSTIRTQIDFAGRLPAVRVIAGRPGLTDYLGFHMDGTKPHPIEAKANRKNPHLRYIARGGNVVFRRRVMHPGTAANPFLERALPAAAV